MTGPVVVGIGLSSRATAEDVRVAVAAALAEVGLDRCDVAVVATLDRRTDDPRIAGLGVPVLGFPPEALALQPGTTPSSVAREAVGTPSVAEAAALLAAGAGSALLVPRRTAALVTVAVARRP